MATTSRSTNQVNDLSEERGENDVDYRTVAYNPNKTLSIDHQRTRLPIFNFKEHIIYLLERFQVLVVVGETGCGKSTQLPQFLYEYGYAESSVSADGTRHIIGVTEPRRIAAISLAARVAEEMNVELGKEVGYSIRFEEFYDKESTNIKFMTEGILIRELMNDPLLSNYSVVIVDEVHERSVNTDILLSLLKKIIRKRPDLKLIISSATLDSGSICDYFNRVNDQIVERATILFVEGRTYPVDIFYMSEPTANYVNESVKTVIKLHENFPNGDVLVFLTGQEEVEDAVRQLKNYAMELRDESASKKMFVLPLYASLTSNDQLRIFQTFPRNVRKVVVATNIAEASVTINGISFVVDSGFVKTRYFNPNTGTDSLVIVPISKASAQQRSGRAGRNKHGYSFRLYPESEFTKLVDFTPPEIERVALPSVILQMKALGINNVVKFDFLTSPPESNIISALDILYALKAIDSDGSLTDPLGLQMAEFPLSPSFSKMLLASAEFGCTQEVLIIAAMLQVQNIFSQPGGGQRAIQARRIKHNLSVEEGDTITYLNIFKQFEMSDKIKSWSDRNYLNYKGLLRASEIRNRLASLLRKFHVPMKSSDDVDSIRKCLVAGFFTNAARFDMDGIYRTIRGDHELHIHPNSVLYTMKRPPKFVIFTEVIHTTKEYMKDVTAIKSNWLYEIAPHYYEYGTDREVMERNQPTKT
ncbi:hypothetical protein RDWZM_007058 [Blomia tropicalis]|uniref:RNA helicase n=1 Tax=Blomia tropicalis TaxID=40697 RepID=A0A9Q0RPV3_BLOTA|nr:hypothetical protein RDWZM_007058 [Blomia tropicalis]